MAAMAPLGKLLLLLLPVVVQAFANSYREKSLGLVLNSGSVPRVGRGRTTAVPPPSRRTSAAHTAEFLTDRQPALQAPRERDPGSTEIAGFNP